MGKRGRAIGLTVIAATTAIVSCSAIFGLDPPTRAPEDPTAPEAAIDATSGNADGDSDAAEASDGESAAIGIRCGFPDSQVFCTGGKVQCCVATPNAAGTYACVNSVDSGCVMTSTHYVFECTAPSDCPNGHCCHYNEHAVCGTDCTTSRNEICDLDAGCRGNLICSPLSINGNLTPYFGCQ